jgi:hypothetical protein
MMIGGCARDYLHAKLGGWGSGGTAHIEAEALAEYERCFCRPEAIHSASGAAGCICGSSPGSMLRPSTPGGKACAEPASGGAEEAV